MGDRKEELMVLLNKGKDLLPAVKKNQSTELVSYTMSYEPADSSHYMFTTNIGEDVNVRFTESDSSYSYSETIDYEYDESVPQIEWPYYAFAAGIGALTGIVASVENFDQTLEKINEWTDKKWGNTIVGIAKTCGFKEKDQKLAKRFLADRIVSVFKAHIPDNQAAILREYLKDLAKHPSSAGLLFSILTQFKGEKICFDKEDKIVFEALPEYYAIGNSVSEKILYGLSYWIFNIVVNTAVAKNLMLDNLHLPKQLIKPIKDLCATKLGITIPSNIEESEKMFSDFLRSLFMNTDIEKEIEEEQEDKEYNNLVGAIKELIKTEIKHCFPVLLNEALVRVFYVVYRSMKFIKERNYLSFKDFLSLKPEEIMPCDSRIILRMNTVSYAVFVASNLGVAVTKALLKAKKSKKQFAKVLLTEINIPGIIRLVIAVSNDMPYLKTDIKVFFNRFFRTQADDVHGSEKESTIEETFKNASFEELELDPSEARALFSIEALAIQYDIDKTDEKPETKQKKEKWLKEWKSIIVRGVNGDPDKYFVDDEDKIYTALYSLAQNKQKAYVFYLLYLELVLFDPFTPLSEESSKEYKGLKYKGTYITEQFIRRQTVLSQDDAANILKLYKKYKGLISGSTQKAIIVATAAALVTAATGGIAWAFAPGIAVALGGSSLAGLHGIALTNAALAAIGGGSLAAGGLGVAGGTAIIAGGGALIGLTGSGAAALTTVIGQTPSEQWIMQCAKLVVYCKTVVADLYHENEKIGAIALKIKELKEEVERIITDLETENVSLDEKLIKNLKNTAGYLSNTEQELEKLNKA